MVRSSPTPADRPTSSTSRCRRSIARTLLKDLQAQARAIVAMLFICTHDQASSAASPTMDAVMQKGKIVEAGPAATVFAIASAMVL